MNNLKTTIGATLILLTTGCAATEFRVLDGEVVQAQESAEPGQGNVTVANSETTLTRTPNVVTTPSTPKAPGSSNGGSSTNPNSESNSGNSNASYETPQAPPPVVVTESSTTPSGGRCTAAFEAGHMCAGGTGIVLNSGAAAEAQCRAYCESRNAGCCAIGKTNFNSQKSYCHAGAQARVRYVNNYAQLFPQLVAAGRKTEIKALNCRGVQPSTFTWGTAETVSKECLKNFDFRLYGEVPGNADVLAYTRGNVAQLEAHWHQFGNVEGRDLNRNWAAIRRIFNIDQYLAEQPDVLLAGVHPWSHYQSCGSYEGRRFVQ